MSERQRLAAIAKWLRTNGYDRNGYNKPLRRRISWGVNPWQWIEVQTLSQNGGLTGIIVEARVVSVQQAADLLVIIGILPVEFASWTPAECDIWDETALVSTVRR